MKRVEERVIQALKDTPETRDDDMKLYALVIRRFYNPSIIGSMSALELLNNMWKTKIPHLSSILRMRQKLQQHDASLRGNRYLERQEKSKKFKEDILNWNNKQSDLFK